MEDSKIALEIVKEHLASKKSKYRLAKQIGVSPTTITRWIKNGGKPGYQATQAILKLGKEIAST
jgi:DNA-binding MurR/RpiR family transcriptional regulator